MNGPAKKILIGLSVLVVLVLVGARIAYGRYVKSPAFRTMARQALAGAVQSVMPGAKVDIAAVEAAGLAAIQMRDVTIAAGRHGIKAKRVRIDPGYVKALFSQSVPFSVEAAVEVGAAISAVGTVPRAWIFGDTRTGGVDVKGRVSGFDAVALANLLLPGKPSEQFQFSAGKIDGDFAVKGGGRSQTASFDGALKDAQWRAKALGNRPITAASIPLAIAFKDDAVELTQPFVFSTPIGRVNIEGAVRSLAAAARWDLSVDPQNNPLLRLGMARLFRCTAVPGSGPFKVTGPVGAATCGP